jgi:chromosome partitioning protein
MQGLTRWWRRRANDGIELVDISAADLSVALPLLAAKGFGIIVIDTPPSAGAEVQAAVAVADVVLTPVRPSPDDLDAVGETVDLVEKAGKGPVFVVNAATRKARLTADAAVALSQHGTVAPSTLHRADAYASSALDGRTVLETDPSGKPAEEVLALWRYIAPRMGLEVRSAPDRPTLKLVGGKRG